MTPMHQKCRRCGLGELRIVPPVFRPYVVVHCQNPECDVTYEETLSRIAPSRSRVHSRPARRARKR